MTATTRDAVNQTVSTPWVSAVLTSPQARSFGTYVFSFFTLFLLWHLMATYIFPSVLFSPPLAVFKKAVELDPGYARAYAGLAYCAYLLIVNQHEGATVAAGAASGTGTAGL